MNGLRFWKKITLLTLGKLCQQPLLLAGLAFLCLLLPVAAGSAAETVLSRGVSFSGITLAITAPEGDAVPQQLEQVLSGMRDVRQYCQVVAMDNHGAQEALARGEVTAVLVLPEDFVQGILNGTNPDVALLVNADAPLEALLTFWVGQSASDLLAAFQSGIYAVLELYTEQPPAGLTYDDVVMKINLRYISWMMNRQSLYQVQEIPVAGQLPVGLHYSLGLFAWFVLTLAPMLTPVYDAKWIRSQRRYRAVGRGGVLFYSGTAAACWAAEFVLMLVFLLTVVRGDPAAALMAALVCSLFCAAFGSVCCLLTPDTGSCGVVSFVAGLVFLVLSGGILPPVLMPAFLQPLMKLSPVAWLRDLLALPGGYEPESGIVAALLLASAGMLLAGGLLYPHRSNREVTGT